MSEYAFVLLPCPESAAPAVQAALERVFELKKETCQSIISSAPIVFVGNLDRRSAAAVLLGVRHLEIAGASIQIRKDAVDELPRINWPKPPKVHKQSIETLISEYDFSLAGSRPLIEQLELHLEQLASASAATAPAPQTAPAPAPPPAATIPPPSDQEASREVFDEVELGEITPFSNQALSSTPPQGMNLKDEDVDLLSRMEQMFPDEDGVIPNTADVSSALDQLLPDDEDSIGGTPASDGGATFSLFLARIGDNGRRQKAIPLLQEIIGIEEAEAEALSKKVIIPVLKNVTRPDAEAVKRRFAEIGVLARIKGA